MTRPLAENSASCPCGHALGHLGRQADLRARPGGVVHLGGHRALPDQLVQAELVARQLATGLLGRAERLAGRADGLVGLLRVLDLALVAAGRVGDVGVAVHLAGLGAGRRQRLVRQRRRVGAHVGDEALLVEALGHLHGPLGAEAELAPASCCRVEVMNGAAGERRNGRSVTALTVKELADQRRRRPTSPPPRPAPARRPCRSAPRARRSPCRWRRRSRPSATRAAPKPDGGGVVGEGAVDAPPGGGAEAHAGPLALDHHAGGHALHPAGRQPRHDLAPQDRGDLVAVEAVEDAARLLGVDQAAVEVAPLLDGPGDGRRGDLVEDHALDRAPSATAPRRGATRSTRPRGPRRWRGRARRRPSAAA